MAIQTENLCDCLKELYPDFHFVFLFDHSSGHSKLQDDGLKASNLGVDYGGVQKHIRDSVICQDCIGNEPDRIVNVGDTYSHQFKEDSNDKPMHMLSVEAEYHRNEDQPKKYDWKSDAQIRKALNVNVPPPPNASTELLRYMSLKNDVIDSKKLVPCNVKHVPTNLSDDELRHLLQAQDLLVSGTTKTLQRRCTSHGLPTTKHVTTGLKRRWIGSPKGLKQICVERGLVALQKTLVRGHYSKEGKKIDGGNDGDYDLATSYIYILSQMKDFKNEKPLLGKIVEEHDYEVWLTPKYHCELAGEGIEYMWGFTKWIYRRIPKAKKKLKKDFFKSVKELITNEQIPVDCIRRFSRRARRYIAAYYANHHRENNGVVTVDKKVSLKLIEKTVKVFKTHRAAIDSDTKFIKEESERC